MKKDEFSGIDKIIEEKQENWEDEFDKSFVAWGENPYCFNEDGKEIVDNVKSFIRRQIAQAEKIGYEEGLNEGTTLCNFSELVIRQEARKEIVSEIEKWAKENQEDDGEIIFVDYTALLSKLKQLK